MTPILAAPPATASHACVQRGCFAHAGAQWVREGGSVVRRQSVAIRTSPSLDNDPSCWLRRRAAAQKSVHVMLHKPRGLVTTADDERGAIPSTAVSMATTRVAGPVVRLDQASAGLLLFTNDPQWAARLTDPTTGPDKTYHVQVDRIPDAALFAALLEGVEAGDVRLRAKSAQLLRAGGKNAWLEIVLDEGRNRQLRRLLAAFDINVLRLVRVAIGGLILGVYRKASAGMAPAEIPR